MNRTFWLGVAVFLCLVGVGMWGSQPAALGFHGWHAHHGCWGCYGCGGPYVAHWRWCHGCWGGGDCRGWASYDCGCSGYVWSSCHGCWGCHGSSSCWGCSGCHGCSGAVWSDEPAGSGPGGSTPGPQSEETTSVRARRAGNAQLNVQVPADATVIVNGHLTQSTGADRQYVSKGLEAGRSYRYELLVELVRGEQTLRQTKTVELRANQSASLQFDFEAAELAAR